MCWLQLSAEGPVAPDRYELHGPLGQGGMAVVYAATDRVRNRTVALKRLISNLDPVKQRRNVELFELEFHTLAQLAHPRVVEVYDFGLSPEGAFYTMELLDGGDLHQLAPLPWRTACAVARDVCSALSLLHSRRLVHRDISPRNVRCTASGSAKLIDFGALSAMGASKLLVGTPPCCPPESLQLQALDGRADLYALGATLYYALVGRHAHHARNFVGLQEAWRAGFSPPSSQVPDIPPALDALILDLLRLDPDARPASAAEVLQRLAAIDGVSANEVQAAAAYLTTPSLVGREHELSRVQRRFERLPSGRGRSIVLEGPGGVGRSRLLDACVLDATLRGLHCLRADADDALGGEYAVVRALSRQLFALAPQLAEECARPHLASLSQLLPELESAASPTDGDEAAVRPRLQLAVREWWKALAARRPLVIAVDDFRRIDEPSAALLAVLAAEAVEHPLCLLISIERDAAPSAPAAQKLLLDASQRVSLENLTPEQSEQLLGALFGRVPRLSLLAHRVQPLCAGNPRDLLRLAQHLIDRGLVRYDSGAWILPEELERAPLPSSMAAALSARIAGLRPSARRLADAFALCPDQAFTLSECALLAESRDPAALAADLDALTQAELSKRHGDVFALAHGSWLPLLAATIAPERALLLHERLGELLEARGDGFRAMRHFERAGQDARALDVLVPWVAVQLARARQRDTASRPDFRAPAQGWSETYHVALRACERLGRPAHDKYLLLERLTSISALYGIQDREPMVELLALLARASGLSDYAELASLPAAERLTTALARAQERYQSTPERERTLDPRTAIRELGRATTVATAMIAVGLDLPWARSLPDLAPFAPLSPALSVINMLTAGMRARLSGRIAQARGIYREVIERLSEPDHGVDPVRQKYLSLAVMNVLGTLEAASGIEHCLEWAARIEAHFVYEVNALVIRRLFALFQGDTPAADGFKGQIEALRVQTSSRQVQEGMHLLWEVDAHAWSEDLTRLRHSIEELAPLAERHAGWAPVVRYALAEHHRIRHGAKRALAEIETALLLAQAGEHQSWASMAQSHVRILLDLGQALAAVDKADEYVAAAAAMLGEVPAPLQLARALAYATVGRAEALEIAAGVLCRLHAAGVTGLLLGCAHEAFARCAHALGDVSTFNRELEHCRDSYAAHRSPALSAKYHRLRQLRHAAAGGGRPAGASDTTETSVASRIGLALAACRDKEQRAKLALTFLCRQSGASAGSMFELGGQGPECIASVGETTAAAVAELLPRIQMYWMEETENIDTTDTDSQVEEAPQAWSDSSGRLHRPILLSHRTSDNRIAVTGVALLCVPPHAKFSYPAETAAEISRFAADVGDSSVVVLFD
ncbi:MAG TPA: AAA family ATPase [Polyangiales bacterium]|nr:AAA family ATPase [Polyangiales bacterium]